MATSCHVMSSSALETETSAVVAANTYFTRLNTVDFFERSLHLLARKPTTFLTISLVFVGLQTSFQWLTVYLFTDPRNADDYDETSEYEYAYVDMSDFDTFAEVFAAMAHWIIFYVANSLVIGATVRVVAELYVGEADRHVTALLAIGTAAHHLVQLVGSCLLITVAMMLPLMVVALIIVFLFMALSDDAWIFVVMAVLGMFVMVVMVTVLTYHTYPVIVVEKAGIVQSVQRSIQLTKGHRCEIFSILLLLAIFNLVLSIPYVIATSMDTTSSQYIAGAVNFVVLVFTTSFVSIMKTVVYFHVRVVKENYKPEDLAAELEHVTADAATPYENMDTTDEPEHTSHGPDKKIEIV